jgi:hypothetical protein
MWLRHINGDTLNNDYVSQLSLVRILKQQAVRYRATLDGSVAFLRDSRDVVCALSSELFCCQYWWLACCYLTHRCCCCDLS